MQCHTKLKTYLLDLLSTFKYKTWTYDYYSCFPFCCITRSKKKQIPCFSELSFLPFSVFLEMLVSGYYQIKILAVSV